MESREAIVIGAGPAGLATAAMLKKRGADVLVLERDAGVGSSWRKHYDRLHLHTVRWLSHLPGYKMPSRYGKWVAHDDVVEYLNDYVTAHNLDVRENTEVASLTREGDQWAVAATDGQRFSA